MSDPILKVTVTQELLDALETATARVLLFAEDAKECKLLAREAELRGAVLELTLLQLGMLTVRALYERGKLLT
jgi:hypothetical protein